jgi:SRSO17 transposase
MVYLAATINLILARAWGMLAVADDARVTAMPRGLSRLMRCSRRLQACFGNAAVRRHGRAYLLGWLSHQERKNSSSLAEFAADVSPDGIATAAALLAVDEDTCRDATRRYVVGSLGDPGAVLIVDETGFLQKGTRSAGVARQYTGTAGRVENAQVGVFLAVRGAGRRPGADRPGAVPAGEVGR